MIISREDKKDFDNIINVLYVLDKKTNGRYRRYLVAIREIFFDLDTELTKETNFRSKLNKFYNKGFKINKYLTDSYNNFVLMEQKLNKLCKDLEDLERIVISYQNLNKELKKSEIAKRLESIMYDPEKLMEAKSLLYKLTH